MSKKGGSSAPKMPTAAELEPLLKLQSRYNRVGVETPYGSQRYRTNEDGTTTLVTDIGDDGEAMVNRAGQLGMTDSARMQAPSQLDTLAGALAGRVGNRLGANVGSSPFALSQTSTPQAKPTPATTPPSTGLPPPPTSQPPPTGRPAARPGWRQQYWNTEDLNRQVP